MIGGPNGGSTSTGTFDSGRRDSAQHGTEAGYWRHIKIGETPCDDCREERNRRVRMRRGSDSAGDGQQVSGQRITAMSSSQNEKQVYERIRAKHQEKILRARKEAHARQERQ